MCDRRIWDQQDGLRCTREDVHDHGCVFVASSNPEHDRTEEVRW